MHIERNRIESNRIELDTPIFLGDTINASYLCNVKTIGHPHFQRRFRHETDTMGSRRIDEGEGVEKSALTSTGYISNMISNLCLRSIIEVMDTEVTE